MEHCLHPSEILSDASRNTERYVQADRKMARYLRADRYMVECDSSTAPDWDFCGAGVSTIFRKPDEHSHSCGYAAGCGDLTPPGLVGSLLPQRVPFCGAPMSRAFALGYDSLGGPASCTRLVRITARLDTRWTRHMRRTQAPRQGVCGPRGRKHHPVMDRRVMPLQILGAGRRFAT